MLDIFPLLRKNIRSLIPYSSARNEFSEGNAVLLDANENPYNKPYNRYPDPLQVKLKEKIAKLKKVDTSSIFLGNGSDEAIDLLIRAFCEPCKDNIISIKPTYGMYKVCADINDVEFRESLLNENYQPDINNIQSITDNNSKILFLCSPNNPTSNNLDPDTISLLIKNFNGIVVLDEAYIDFSLAESFTSRLNEFPNLVVLQTLSKAWGMAGIRLGMAFGSREIIDVLNRIKFPYNVNIITQEIALKELNNENIKQTWIRNIISQREYLRERFKNISIVKNVLPSDANFLMVKFDDATDVYKYLKDKGIIVRDRSKVALCEGFLRITIGTEDENSLLLDAMEKYKPQNKYEA